MPVILTFFNLIPTLAFSGLCLRLGLGELLALPGLISFVLPRIFAVGMIVVFAIRGCSSLRWGPAARLEQKRWLNFRKFLIDSLAIEQAPIGSLPISKQCYVYAVVLGVAQKFWGVALWFIPNNLPRTSLSTTIWYVATATSPIGLAFLPIVLVVFNPSSVDFPAAEVQGLDNYAEPKRMDLL